MENNSLPEQAEFKVQLEVQRLDYYLRQNPEQANKFALEYYESFLTLVYQNKVLETELNTLKQKRSSPPSVPPFKVKKNY